MMVVFAQAGNEIRHATSSKNKHFYFMLSGRISRNIGENIFRPYIGTIRENTYFHVLLPRLIARTSQPDRNMTSFTLHYSRLT